MQGQRITNFITDCKNRAPWRLTVFIPAYQDRGPFRALNKSVGLSLPTSTNYTVITANSLAFSIGAKIRIAKIRKESMMVTAREAYPINLLAFSFIISDEYFYFLPIFVDLIINFTERKMKKIQVKTTKT